jgi:hypothetical protein
VCRGLFFVQATGRSPSVGWFLPSFACGVSCSWRPDRSGDPASTCKILCNKSVLATGSIWALNGSSPLPAALVCRAYDAWPSGTGINPLANFLSYSEGSRGVGLARLICTRCRKDVKSVLRCRSCGTLCPTSQIGAAMLSPSAFAFYGLISIVVAIFWFA